MGGGTPPTGGGPPPPRRSPPPDRVTGQSLEWQGWLTTAQELAQHGSPPQDLVTLHPRPSYRLVAAQCDPLDDAVLVPEVAGHGVLGRPVVPEAHVAFVPVVAHSEFGLD
jgi:hypothetical protein